MSPLEPIFPRLICKREETLDPQHPSRALLRELGNHVGRCRVLSLRLTTGDLIDLFIHPTPSHPQAQKRHHLASTIPFFVRIRCVVFQFPVAPLIGMHPSFIALPISSCVTFPKIPDWIAILSYPSCPACKVLTCAISFERGIQMQATLSVERLPMDHISGIQKFWI